MGRPRLGFYSPFLTAAQKSSLGRLEQALEQDDETGVAAAMNDFLELAFEVTKEAVLEFWTALDVRTFEEIRDEDEDSDVADQLRQLLWNGDRLSPFANRLLAWNDGRGTSDGAAMTMAELNNYLGASVDFYEGLRPVCPSGEITTLPALNLLEPPPPSSLELPGVVVEPSRTGETSGEQEEALTMIELVWEPRPEPVLELPPPIIKETPAVLKLLWEGGALPEPVPMSPWRSELQDGGEPEEGESEEELKVLILGGPPEVDWSIKKQQAPEKDLLPLLPLFGREAPDDDEELGGESLLESRPLRLELLKDPEPVFLPGIGEEDESDAELLEGPAEPDSDEPLFEVESPEELPLEEVALAPLEDAVLTEPYEPSEELAEEPAEESVEEPAGELAEEQAEESAEEQPEELAEEQAEESAEEQSEELAEEQAEESAEEPAEELAEEQPEEFAEEQSEEQAEESAEEPAEQMAGEQPDEAREPAPPRAEMVPPRGAESDSDDLPLRGAGKPVPAEEGVEVIGLSSAPLSPHEERSQIIMKKKYLGYGKNSDGVMGYCGQLTLSRFDDAALNARLECSNPLLFLSPTTPTGKAPVVTYWMPPAAFPQPGGHLTINTSDQNKVLSVVSLFPQSRTDFLSASQVLLLLYTPSILGLLYFAFVYLLSASGIVAQVKEIFPEAYAAAMAGSMTADFRAQGVGLYQLEVVPASESLQLIWAGLIWLCPLIATKFFRHLSRSRQRELGAALAGALVLPSIGLLLIWNAQKLSFPLFAHADFAPLDLRYFLPWGVPLNLAVATYLFLSVHGVWDRRLRSGELRFLLPVIMMLLYAVTAFVLIFGRSWLA